MGIKIKPYYTWVAAGFVITGLICWSQFSKGTEFQILGVMLPDLTWLALPFLVAGLAYRVLSNPSTPDVFTKEIQMEPSEKLLVEFLQSPEKAKYGPASDRVKCMEVYSFRKNGDYGYKLEMDGEDWVLLLDGRVNPPNGNRAYTMMPWRKLHQSGFDSLYDMEKKLTGINNGNPISQLLSELDPDELTDLLKATGGNIGGVGNIRNMTGVNK